VGSVPKSGRSRQSIVQRLHHRSFFTE
jgi:hypothetical protein